MIKYKNTEYEIEKNNELIITRLFVYLKKKHNEYLVTYRYTYKEAQTESACYRLDAYRHLTNKHLVQQTTQQQQQQQKALYWHGVPNIALWLNLSRLHLLSCEWKTLIGKLLANYCFGGKRPKQTGRHNKRKDESNEVK